MKIAHFTIFAPHISGQYATVKDLILAERSVGIDAQLIDYGLGGKPVSRVGLVDGDITTVPVLWAVEEADTVIRHGDVSKEVLNKPMILALHGRPENSCRLEQYEKSPIISTIRNIVNSNKYRTMFTFWEEFVHTWTWITGRKIHYVPAPINFDDYQIDGEKHDFGKFGAGLNLVVTDMWREDRTPFNLIFAAQYFQEHYHKDTKLHICGAPVKKSFIQFLSYMQKNGVVGEVRGLTRHLDRIYAATDMLLTPNIIATRTIREAMASGVPMVAPVGCPYTPYTADPRDYKSFAKMINNCFRDGVESETLRNKAFQLFDPTKTGLAMKQLCEDVLSMPAWNGMSITETDWDDLEAFIREYDIKSVVEFGPGISTQLFDKKGLNITAIETDQVFIDKIKKTVPNATYILWDGKSTLSLNGHDMAFIDGPHYGRNREPSYKSVFNSDVPIVVCHDMDRPEDRQWVDKYFYNWKELAKNNRLLMLERP